MLSRLFKKAQPQDQREHYRRALGQGAALGVKLICANGARVAGTLADLSAGGAAIEFDGDEMAAELAIGEVRELVFSSLTKTSIRALAEVKSLPHESAPRRYGFQFIDGEALFAAVDDTFYKYFNRRRFRRAKPALGENLKVDIGFGNVAETVSVYDISVGGISFHLDAELAASVQVDMPIEVKLKVPKTDHHLTHYGIVRHMTPDSRGVRVGVSMDVVEDSDSKRSLRKAETALRDYIQSRLDEMDKYNSAYN